MLHAEDISPNKAKQMPHSPSTAPNWAEKMLYKTKPQQCCTQHYLVLG
jgi:hypothetical protein